jgi:hypothetical protein
MACDIGDALIPSYACNNNIAENYELQQNSPWQLNDNLTQRTKMAVTTFLNESSINKVSKVIE